MIQLISIFKERFDSMKTALVIYWSKSGNTKKVATAIQQGLEDAELEVTMKEPYEAEDIDFFNYDLVCVGSPSYSWHPPEPMDKFLKNKFAKYRQQEKIKPNAPRAPDKNVLIFITYSGPHTGLDEAIPAGKYIGQFFDHLGFKVLAEWYILSEFHGSLENSTLGRMGDIRGKPTKQELEKITKDTTELVQKYLQL